MNDIAIRVENLSKAYQLGDFGTGSLTTDVERWWALMRGKEDPFLKVGETNDRTTKGESNIVWSLKDINFDITEGDAVGIIGRNGAGKSTLLKLLSRVTSPTTGNIKVKGRIASLLEVGTGFHPELTGGENIYLNGAIMGMNRREIKRKFDEIVDFAGVERYIDTPVRRYSSGMYVRLAFAVAAYLESEILIVDEVLAVGDAEFQKKCLGKMNDVSKGEGRTVLFVSHNIASIYALTNRCIYMQNGQLVKMGDTAEITQLYQNNNLINAGNNLRYVKQKLDDKKPIELLSAKIINTDPSHIQINVSYVVRRNVGSVVAIKLTNIGGVAILTLRDTDKNKDVFAKTPGQYGVTFIIPVYLLTPNIFNVTISLADMKSERFDYFEDLLSFEVEENDNLTESTASREGIIRPTVDLVTETLSLTS